MAGGKGCVRDGGSLRRTTVIPALVAGIQLSAHDEASGAMDPGDEPRDDMGGVGVATPTRPRSGVSVQLADDLAR